MEIVGKPFSDILYCSYLSILNCMHATSLHLDSASMKSSYEKTFVGVLVLKEILEKPLNFF